MVLWYLVTGKKKNYIFYLCSGFVSRLERPLIWHVRTKLSPSIYNNYNNNIYVVYAMSRSLGTCSEGWGFVRVMLPAHFLHFVNPRVRARADHAGGRPSIMRRGATDFIPYNTDPARAQRRTACPKTCSHRLRRAGLLPLPKWRRVLPEMSGVHSRGCRNDVIIPFVPIRAVAVGNIFQNETSSDRQRDDTLLSLYHRKSCIV